MLLDQPSLLAAIACSSAALTVTLFVGWLGSRRDVYLLSWSLGVATVVAGVIVFGTIGPAFSPLQHFVSFALTIAGFAAIYAGALQFRGQPIPLAAVAISAGGLVLLVGVGYLAGLSGLGTMFANLGMALLMAMSGYQYWAGRREAVIPMTVNAILYFVTAITFVLCAAVLLAESRFVLDAVPDNWAEDLNSMMVIVGLTGIGAISLTLNQSRWARHHHREARTDQLTGLLNRRALFDKFAETALPAGTAVIMFDLDHFKSINDRLGHAAGDLVLESFATILADNLRQSDAAARLGGEEFCAVLTDLSLRSGSGVAERIRTAFEATAVHAPRGQASTTVSAGVAISGIDGEPFEHVLRRADEALYAAKSEGRNRVSGPAPRLVA